MQQEKNILVNRGIPRTPPSSSPSPNHGHGGTPDRSAGRAHIGTDGDSSASPSFSDYSHAGFEPAIGMVLHTLKSTTKTAESTYQTQLSKLPQTIENDLAAIRLEGSTRSLPPAAAIARELSVRNTLLARKTAQFHQKTALANSFYGVDPIGKPLQAFYPKALTLERLVPPNGIAIKAWATSLKAAYEARLLSQAINMLNQQQVEVLKWLAAVQAQEQVQKEVQRLAAEKAQKVAQALREAEERAKIAAVAATKARQLAEAEKVAAKQAHDAAMALWEAERWAAAEELEAEEARRQAEVQKARQPARATRTFPVSGSAAAAGPVFTIAGGTFAPNRVTASSITDELRTAVSAILKTVTAKALPAVAWFASLIDPSELGNEERYALSVPLSELAPANTDDLLAIAASKGEINLPIVLGSMTTDDEMMFVVASADGTSVPSSVPVRLATLDPHSNVYKSYSPDGSSTLMTWTPIVKETDASTTLPSIVPKIDLYEGGTPWAITRGVDKDPELEDYDFGNGFVTVFPVESGIPPIYTVFNNSSEWASAEEARKAAEAQILRVAQAQALEQVLAGRAYPIPGAAAAAGPVLTLVGSSLAISSEVTLAIQAALRAAVAMAIESLTAVAVPTLAGFAALLYSPKLANGELPERYAFSTPLSELAPIQHHDFHAIAAADGFVDLPVRLTSQATVDSQSEILVINIDGVTHPSKVRVVPVTYDAQQNLYIATTEQTPPRTLTWTPVVQPGNSSTALPAEPPAPPVYTGASVTPIEGRIDPFPEITADSFDDYVFVFPIDSGLPPLYVMFRDRREDPGVALGMGAPVSGVWTDAASKGEGAAIPSQIADQLRGREFRNFRKFREAFWKAVAGDPILSQQFNLRNRVRMENGRSAYVRKAEKIGARIKYELHHKHFVSLNGQVYDIDNITLTTPKRHIEIHRERKQ